MSFQDRTLSCSDCGKDFTFTVGEQEFYAQRGFTNEPKRCEDCRSKRKAQGGGGGGGGKGGFRSVGGGGGSKPKFPAVCSRCNANFDAPFQPKEGRPVFCRDCFEASKGGARHSR